MSLQVIAIQTFAYDILTSNDGNWCYYVENGNAMVCSAVYCNSILSNVQEYASDVNNDGIIDGFDAIQFDCYLNRVCDIYGK